MFVVVKQFIDRFNGHMYNVGDEFPYDNAPVRENRVDELLAGHNGVPFIEVVSEATEGAQEDAEDANPTETSVESPKPKGRPKKRKGE